MCEGQKQCHSVLKIIIFIITERFFFDMICCNFHSTFNCVISVENENLLFTRCIFKKMSRFLFKIVSKMFASRIISTNTKYILIILWKMKIIVFRISFENK